MLIFRHFIANQIGLSSVWMVENRILCLNLTFLFCALFMLILLHFLAYKMGLSSVWRVGKWNFWEWRLLNIIHFLLFFWRIREKGLAFWALEAVLVARC